MGVTAGDLLGQNDIGSLPSTHETTGSHTIVAIAGALHQNSGLHKVET